MNFEDWFAHSLVKSSLWWFLTTCYFGVIIGIGLGLRRYGFNRQIAIVELLLFASWIGVIVQHSKLRKLGLATEQATAVVQVQVQSMVGVLILAVFAFDVFVRLSRLK